MAGLMATSSLTTFAQFLEADLPKPSTLPPFIVLELNRYYPEPSVRRCYGIDSCHFWDVFDITLCDRVYKVKFVLTADARLKQKIVAGCFVQLKKFSRYWDEGNTDKKAIVVVQELQVVNEKKLLENTADLESLPWCDICSSKQTENVPLISSRCYYVDNWTINVPPKSTDNEVVSCNLSSIDKAGIVSIKDIMTKKVSQYSKPSVLVKVMRKCRLIHYIGYSREDKWPFQLPLMVGDKSGWCTVVLWNKLALQMLDKIHEGSLLFLKNFRMKTSIQQKTKSFFNPPQGTTLFSREFSMDSQNPATEVKLVTCQSDCDRDGFDFPSLEWCFMTRRDLVSVPDFSTVDVAGLITFVGRVEREPKIGSGSRQEDSGAFYYRRWLLLRDSSLCEPIVALIYSGEQKDTFFSLKPGQYLLCRHMLTNQSLNDLISSRQRRHGWLTTAAYSRLYVFNCSDTEGLPDILTDVIKTNMPRHPSDYSDLFQEGGIFRYPPFPCSIESLQKSRPEALQMVIPSCHWKESCNRMTWRECHQLTVHAVLTSVVFTRVSKEKTTAVRSSPRKKLRVVQNIPDSTSDNDDDTSDVGATLSDDISELWPSALTGSRSKYYSAFLFKWQGLNDPVILNTIKPCAFSTHNEMNNFIDFVAGAYDSDLGLVDCIRSKPTSEEIKILKDSAHLLVNCRFILLLDVYTNSNNRQLIVLNRAFKI